MRYRILHQPTAAKFEIIILKASTVDSCTPWRTCQSHTLPAGLRLITLQTGLSQQCMYPFIRTCGDYALSLRVKRCPPRLPRYQPPPPSSILCSTSLANVGLWMRLLHLISDDTLALYGLPDLLALLLGNRFTVLVISH